jgi:peptide/nickel transport system substrate-binding protein
MGDPVTLSQKLNAAGAGSIPGADALEQLVNAGLVVLDAGGVLRPQLADAVPTVENGLWTVHPDGTMATTWRIRPGGQWHDGAPFTSADLLFTAQIGQDRDLAAFRDLVYDAIASMEAPNPQTIVVHWKRPFIAADTLFTTLRALPLPRHLLDPTYQTAKETLTELPYWSQDFVGTGPFRLRQWVRGSHMVADANERYALGRPKIDSIEVRFIPDANALVASVLAGLVELTLGRNLSLETAIDTRDRWPTGRMEVGLKSWIALFPQFLNPSPPALADIRFRRALLHGVDRQQLADSLQAGLTPVAHTLFPPGQAERAAVESSVVRYDYDPRRASQLLAEIGPIPRAPVEIRTIAGDDIIEKATFAVADDWRRLGLITEPLPIPIQRVRDREWRATFPGFELLRQPNDAAAVTRVHSSETPLPDNSFTGTNRSRYRNPDVDTLLDRYVSTIPEAPRVQLLGEIIHHMTDQLVWMGLFYNAEATMVAQRIQHAAANNATGTTQAWNAHEWNVR